MSIKVVLLFQQQTAVSTANVVAPISSSAVGYGARTHLAGWTEFLIWPNDNVSQLNDALVGNGIYAPGLLQSRASLLAQGAAIIGTRFYQGGAGKGMSRAFSYPGTNGFEGDSPSQAMLIKCGSAAAAVTRRFTLRGCPDDFITSGELSLSYTPTSALLVYFRMLAFWGFNAVNPASPTAGVFNVVSVAAVPPATQPTGLVTLTTPTSPFLQGQQIAISKTIDSNALFQTYKGLIANIGPNANQFSVSNWTLGNTNKGTASAKTKTLFIIDPTTCAVSRLVQRKVGRPFEQFRGRRSKRRNKVPGA